jgi:hypothetical protein
VEKAEEVRLDEINNWKGSGTLTKNAIEQRRLRDSWRLGAATADQEPYQWGLQSTMMLTAADKGYGG